MHLYYGTVNKMATPEHCLIIGLDGAVPEVVEKYAKEGLLPHIAKLIKQGAWAENCLPPLPNASPTCWTTVATGASPATHGVTSSSLYDAKRPLTEVRGHAGYLSTSNQAETMWEAAERGGLRSLLISYPTSWPPRSDALQIGTTDTSATDGAFGIKHQLFSTEDLPARSRVRLTRDGDTLQARLTPELEPGRWIVDDEARRDRPVIEPFAWEVAVARTNEVSIHAPDGSGKRIARLRKGEWSGDLRVEARTTTGDRVLKYRIKVIDGSHRARRLTVYVTRMVTTPRVQPASLEPIVDAIKGIPTYRDYFNVPNLETVDLDTFIEIQEMGYDWMASAVKRCRKVAPCAITVVYTVSVDTVNHLYRSILEQEQTVPRKALLQARHIERRTYQAIDSFVGKLLRSRQRNSLVVLLSDHSAVSYGHAFTVEQALKQAGLLVMKKTRKGEEIVLSRSKAICQQDVHIFVNRKGRNPGGIVAPKDHDQVVGRIIAALYDYTDPKTGQKPVALAMRKEDAAVLGLCGDGIGDVVVAVRGGYGRIPGDDVHGHRLPGAEHRGKKMRCLLLMAGPGIKSNVRIERPVALQDIAPTVSHMMGFPTPRDTEGGIIYQMLEE